LKDDGNLFRGAACPACHDQREHTRAELLQHHPFARKDVWTDEELHNLGKLMKSIHDRAKTPTPPESKT
jgi:hypothetical protein